MTSPPEDRRKLHQRPLGYIDKPPPPFEAHAFQYIRSDLIDPPKPSEIMDPEDDHPAWVRIKSMHDKGDLEKLEKMVRVYDGLEALGTVGSIVAKFLAWCGGIGGAYLAVEWWVRSVK